MASFNNAIPMLPKVFDLEDATDRVARLLEVADQVTVQLLGQLYPIVIDASSGKVYADDLFPRPDFITTDAGIEAYEALLYGGSGGDDAPAVTTQVAACVAANAGYGAYEVAACLQGKLATVPTLK